MTTPDTAGGAADRPFNVPSVAGLRRFGEEAVRQVDRDGYLSANAVSIEPDGSRTYCVPSIMYVMDEA